MINSILKARILTLKEKYFLKSFGLYSESVIMNEMCFGES